MNVQLTFSEGGKGKALERVPLRELEHSRFNGRTTRSDEAVERLAERMARNGFEITRALWVYPAGSGYEVFAGGTRLEAARAAKLDEVPVVVHRGFSDDEIVRLADEDNENDEYHVEVPILDRWADCWRLWKEEGWTQQRIADAKGCDRKTATLRCQLHESCPDAARVAVGDGLLDEGHLRAVLEVKGDVPQLTAWLTTEQAQSELVAEVLDKHRGGSKGIKPTVKNVREAAKRWKATIAKAEEVHAKLTESRERAAEGSAHASEDWPAVFVDTLVKLNARSVHQVERAARQVGEQITQRAREIAAAAEGEADKEAEEQARRERIDGFVSRLRHGDARELITDCPEGATLLATDPPYGMDFQSGRRTTTSKKGKIANDLSPEAAANLTREVLEQALPRLADDATVLVFTGWRHEPLFRQAVEAAGYTIKGSLVWVKNNHGTGDLHGSFAPKHERIIHAVKGSPKLNKRKPDVLMGKDAQNSDHPTEKPHDLMCSLVEACTEPGDLVLEPFAGSGATLFAAHARGRDFWGCELSDEWHRKASERLHAIAVEKFK